MILITLLALLAKSQFIPFLGNATGNHLKQDLIAAWRFEEGSGAAFDSSGNNRHLTATGTVGPDPGIVGQARAYIASSGGNDYLAAASDSGLTFGSAPFTITTWIWVTDRALEPNDMTIATKGDYGGSAFTWWIALDHGTPDDTLYFAFSSDGIYTYPTPAQEVAWVFSGEIPTGYNFVVVRYDGTNIHLSVTHESDTVLETDVTTAFAGPFFNDTSPVIIGTNLGGLQHMAGSIDEFFIWKRYLPNCELQWLFTAKDGVFSYPNFDALTCVNP
jgi:hypothetical protein